MFKIKPEVMNTLYGFRDKLPPRGPGGRYSVPAGLALLGAKESIIDSTVLLQMTSGCWDLPGVSHKKMDDGLQKIVKMDRYVCGMALIRHPECAKTQTGSTELSGDMKRTIREFESSFYDITKTIWMAISNNYYRFYTVNRHERGNILIEEINADKCISGAVSDIKLIRRKRAKDNRVKRRQKEHDSKIRTKS